VIDGVDPIDVRRGSPLRVADRDQRHVGEFVKQLAQFGQIQPTVEGCHHRLCSLPSEGEAKEIQVTVDDVELIQLGQQLAERHCPVG
jgi:hypothetical protein